RGGRHAYRGGRPRAGPALPGARPRDPAARRPCLGRNGPRSAVTTGLVPTMGALHAGHRALLRRARSECDVVVMSLFVNPTQFGPGEDLDTYPRDEERDRAIAAEEGVDSIFAPTVEDMYPGGFSTSVSAGDLGSRF